MNRRRKIKDIPHMRLLSPPLRTGGRVQGSGAGHASRLGGCAQVFRSIHFSLPFTSPRSYVLCYL